MVDVIFDLVFKKQLSRIKDKAIRIKIKKQLIKLKTNPTLGKPMKHKRKGTRELYIPPFRLSYIYKNNIITILALYHKDNQ